MKEKKQWELLRVSDRCVQIPALLPTNCMAFDLPQTLSVQLLSCVQCDCLWPQGLQLTMVPCPSTTPGACSNSCPSHWWCHPTISSSVVPFSSCLQSFPASGSFLMSQFFASGCQGIGCLYSGQSIRFFILLIFPDLESQNKNVLFVELLQGLNDTIHIIWRHKRMKQHACLENCK